MARCRLSMTTCIVWFCGIGSLGFSQTITLNEAYAEALAQNPYLKQKAREVRAAKASLWDGSSPAYPELFAEHEGIPSGSRSLSQWEERQDKYKALLS